MNFSSDNTAPVAPEILDAIVRANEGFAPGYGADPWTAAVERRFSEIFERDVAVFLVPTGTAANALAVRRSSSAPASSSSSSPAPAPRSRRTCSPRRSRGTAATVRIR